jgi:hypothetical protein
MPWRPAIIDTAPLVTRVLRCLWPIGIVLGVLRTPAIAFFRIARALLVIGVSGATILGGTKWI